MATSRRHFVKSVGVVGVLGSVADLRAEGAAPAPAPTPTPVASPLLESPVGCEVRLAGEVGRRVRANLEHWLLTAPSANPAMLQMFRDRDRQPFRDLVPWAGEFAGKYLISAVQAMRMTNDARLTEHLRGFVRDLIATQGEDGYLGPFPTGESMIGKGRWDLWGQYHVMLGLLRWHRQTGDAAALAACRKCADHFCKVFLDAGKRVIQAGSEEMNESSIHVFTLLHRQTGEERYLRLAREIERDWETPPSGDYVRTALAGKAFYQCPKPRWESLHGVQAIAELYFITGDERYRKAFEQIWWTIAQFDRHNTGGFSSGEAAKGNPYDKGAIETCCTIAWGALCIDMLRTTGDSRAADELEISTWNAVLGAQHPSGRWWTYNTPMDGDRKASAHEIVFQARPGSPELNCCSVNGPRGLGMIGEWGVMVGKDVLAVNWYGPGEWCVGTEFAGTVKLVQETNYPTDGRVLIRVTPQRESRFAVWLRIASWSLQTRVRINGEPAGIAPKAGTYTVIDRTWRDGDRVEIDLHMGPWLWAGERESAGRASVYWGPVLLAYDPRFGTHDPRKLPKVDVSRHFERSDPSGAMIRCGVGTDDGTGLILCDFASAGSAGNPYVSWLPCGGLTSAPFTRENPWRAIRAV
jgi:DUF1680 family protein